MKTENEITYAIINAAICVHKALGPGLLESTYASCLRMELKDRNIKFLSELELPVIYRDTIIDKSYRIDLLVEDQIVVELKSVEAVSELHHAQLLTYLKLSKHKVGLLINFNVPVLKNGISRKINTPKLIETR
jgi:GxxExxY protein